jgi:hypothetical protein
VAPPLLTGAVNVTVAVVSPVAVATPIVGAPGTVGGSVKVNPPEIDTPEIVISAIIYYPLHYLSKNKKGSVEPFYRASKIFMYRNLRLQDHI